MFGCVTFLLGAAVVSTKSIGKPGQQYIKSLDKYTLLEKKINILGTHGLFKE